MKPFFSVIIPTLNEEKYLPKLLRALTLQTYRNFEVIIVDANSQDKTVIFANGYKKLLPQLKTINSLKKNVYLQRNLGVKKASGKYIVSLDADITMPPAFLEGIHYNIISKKSDFLTTWLEPDVRNSTNTTIIHGCNLAMEMAKMIGKPFAGGFNTIIKRDIFNKVGGFREDLSMSEDHEFSLRVAKAGYDLTIVNDPRLTFSLRRLRSQGMLKLFFIYSRANLLFFLNGPITNKKYGYEMGGHVHIQRKRKNKLLQFSSYIRQLERLQDKIEKLFYN